MAHTCRACHATITTGTALCAWHADELAELCRTYVALQPALTDALAGTTRTNTSDNPTSGNPTPPAGRDAASAHMLDIKAELDDTFTAWALHYGRPSAGDPIGAASWLAANATTITATRHDAAIMIDELQHAVARLAAILKPTRPPATRCPLCGGPTKPATPGHQCRICGATFTTDEAATILKARAPNLWLASPQLAAYVTLITGTPHSPATVRWHAHKGHITSHEGTYNAADYLATLDNKHRKR